jgi:hypothetical protein
MAAVSIEPGSIPKRIGVVELQTLPSYPRRRPGIPGKPKGGLLAADTLSVSELTRLSCAPVPFPRPCFALRATATAHASELVLDKD